MIKVISVLILMALSLFNSSCSMKKDVSTDLNKLCDLANEMTKISPKSELLIQFMIESNKQELSDETRKFLNDLSIQSDVSYKDFTDFAGSNGVENFQCESIKYLFEKR